MKAIRIAAVAVITLALTTAVGATPVVAQAVPCAGGLPADGKGCLGGQSARHRIPVAPSLPEPVLTAAAPLRTAQVVPPSLPPPRMIPVTDAYGEPTQPCWPSLLLRYMVLLIGACLIAWRVGLSLHRASGL